MAALLASTLGWSLMDLLRKLTLRTVPPMALLFWMTMGLVPVFALWVAVSAPSSIQPAYYLPALASIGLNVVANLAFFASVKRSPLSQTIPLLSLTPVFATLSAAILLREAPNPVRFLGIALVVFGALVLSVAPAARGAERAAGLRLDSGSLLMVGVALLWAATISLDKMAMDRSSAPLHALILMGGIGVASLLLLIARGELRALGAVARAPGLVIASLAVSGLAFALQLVALQSVLVGVLETVKRGVGNVLALLFGNAFFDEPITPQKVIAVLLLGLGVGLVLWPFGP